MDNRVLQWIKIVVLRTIKEKRLYKLDLNELISAGFEGYAQCLSRFDPTRGVKFKTYANHRIRGAVLDEVRKMIGSERLKNKRPNQMIDYDFTQIEEKYSTERAMESKLTLTSFLNNSKLTSTEKLILTKRLQGYNLKEIADEFGFSQSWASQVLKKIKADVHEWFGASFKLVAYTCPQCAEESSVSENVVNFNCDSCDVEIELIGGIPTLMEYESEDGSGRNSELIG